jgi:hypothetical protein
VIVKWGSALFKSEILQELMFEHGSLSNESYERLASNCPNLRALRVGYVDIDRIYLFFPKLESLCCGRVSKFNQIIDHQYLKYFCV